MLEFACPLCGKRVQGDDALAGKHVVCPGCNAAITAPAAPAGATAITDSPPLPPRPPADDDWPPHDAMNPLLKKTRPPYLSLFVLIPVILIVLALCVALFVMPVQTIREPSFRTKSINNLMHIGLGMMEFHDIHGRLPFNGTVVAKANDFASGTWGFQILPFVDQMALFNNPNLIGGVPTYICPGRGRTSHCQTGPWSDYAINPWLNDPKNGAVDAPDGRRTFKDITDGTSNTILVGHGTIDPNLYGSRVAIPQSTDIFKGGAAALARRSTHNQRDKAGDGGLHWGGPFPQGALMCFCDGTVRMIPYEITGGVINNGVAAGKLPAAASQLAPFLTPAGGEAVVLPD